jgi:uncharacterized protein GlcG (DUF336 family)
MNKLTLTEADAIADGALAAAASLGLSPLAVSVVDQGGHLLVFKRQDGASFLRFDVATAKAWTAFSLNSSSRSFATTAENRPQFATSVVSVSGGRMVPAAGGLTIHRDDELIGAVGVSGDTPDNDEAAAAAAIAAVGLSAEE